MSRLAPLRTPQLARIGYFGKIPARSDFIKAGDNHALVELLDGWLADTMTGLTAEPRWKLHYDAMRPLHFAFVGTRSSRAIAGHLVASSDQSQRRFPFLAMSVLEVDDAPAFLRHSPIVLRPFWSALAAGMAPLTSAMHPAPQLHALSANALEIDPHAPAHAASLSDFLGRTTLVGLDAMLTLERSSISARRTMLAMGLLLQPFGWSGSTRLERSLALPLPRDPLCRPAVAALWLSLAEPFLRQVDVELALLMCELSGRPALVLGFAGASPATLRGVIDPQYAETQQITFDSTAWVDDMIRGDHKVLRLSACLEQELLTLESACALFYETFT
ncbi:type VI secretion protein [Massilia sp. Root351]|jgi:type VI secretion system protein ImpM|uniref:type VI secretion system-associated protein TagF n=1 Tax=Massilia sp. Root351 TaxID=1736522 RepID=UPI00070FDA39|nr:type VI secretion system-associated protein TagF [Massilia sp. Root351]KQV85040.1 type VI secretion protein [Massilia sp. Root351]